MTGETPAARVAGLAETLFATGYVFFLPYLALYAVGWAVDVPIELLRRAFVALHVANGALFLVFLWRRRDRFEAREAAFWLALAGVFLWPGAYLEYAADPWEHFRRLFLWQGLDSIDDHNAKWKLAYFWGYSWLSGLEPLERRAGLDVYGAFWLLLTAGHLHVLARRLGFDSVWAKLQVVAFFLFIGIGPLGFRHHALSSTPLAYVALLRALVCCIDFADRGDRRALRELPFLLLLALANHLQEVMFIGLSGGALLGLGWFERQPPPLRARVLRGAGIALLVSFVLGIAVRQLAPALYAPGFDFQLTAFGGFRIWQRWYFMNTYGVHGALAVLLAVALLRASPRIAVPTLVPPLLLLAPPSALGLTWLLENNAAAAVTHRFLFAFPWSFALVEGLRRLVTGTLRTGPGPAGGAQGLLATSALLLLLAAPPTYPWQGRLYYLFHRPHDDLSLRYIDETADWFTRNRSLPSRCRILTDPASQFGLLTHLGSEHAAYVGRRTRPARHAWTIQTPRELLELIREAPTCGVLVGIDAELPDAPDSPISRWSRHWDHRLAVPKLTTGDGFRRAAESLRERGWTRTRVPPWYWLYEPPRAATGLPSAAPAPEAR